MSFLGNANRMVFLLVILVTSGFLFRGVSLAETKAAATGESAPPNHLIHEKSPYLLQHAHNPVDWYPWCEEAFEKARKEDKPIFLSIGYSTCHWCHVMAHESFENVEIADILNRYFVSIKVDREERPDLDQRYMTFVQASTGGGGWPMSVWLTPELKPFAGGTYFPPEDAGGRSGLKTILSGIEHAWETDRGRVRATSEAILKELQSLTAPRATGPVALESQLLDRTYERIKASYDSQFGGFGGPPKFPSPSSPNFMLRYYARSGAQDALDMTLHTLRKMADGGVFDHIGGGFHRYSVDARWHVPHFEKMLYDQALLVCTYLDAYQITHDKTFSEVATATLDYVRRDLTGSLGQFFSAEDADSPIPSDPVRHAEGAFYVWEKKELVDLLGTEPEEIFGHYYGVAKAGNVDDDPRGEFPNKNVLIVSQTLAKTASHFGKPVAQIQTALAEARRKLFLARSRRPRPHLDDKAITAWNGLMISAFSRSYQVLGRPEDLDAAMGGAKFIRTRLYDVNSGRLLRRYRDGDAAIPGFLSDYAFLIQGLLDLYEASFDVEQLTWAVSLQRKQDELFWDESAGGYFSTASAIAAATATATATTAVTVTATAATATTATATATASNDAVFPRTKDEYDGAEPSPNSVALLNLLRLSEMTDSAEFRKRATGTLSGFSGRLKGIPQAMPQMMAAFDFHLEKPWQIIIVGKTGSPDTRSLIEAIHSRFIPNKFLMVVDESGGRDRLSQLLPFLSNLSTIEGKATAYVCRDYVCRLPTTDSGTMLRIIGGKD